MNLSNNHSDLIPNGSIILDQYVDQEWEYVLYLNKNTIEKNSPVQLTFKGNYYPDVTSVMLDAFGVNIFSQVDFKEYDYSVAVLEDGSFQFTQTFDQSFPEGAYKFSIDNYVKSFKLYKSVNQDTSIVPDWIKNNAKWWSDGVITDDDFLKGIQFLVNNGIIKVN